MTDKTAAEEFREGLDELATPLPLPSKKERGPTQQEPIPAAPGALELFDGDTEPRLPILQDFQNGELITTPARAAMYLDRLRELQRDVLRREIRQAEEFLLALMDQRGEYTMHLPGGLQAVGSTEFASEKVEWDLTRLRVELEATGLPDDRVNAVIQTVVSEKVNLTEAKRVAASSPARAAAIAAAQTRVPGRRHVQIEPDTSSKRVAS